MSEKRKTQQKQNGRTGGRRQAAQIKKVALEALPEHQLFAALDGVASAPRLRGGGLAALLRAFNSSKNEQPRFQNCGKQEIRSSRNREIQNS